jgi:hypothetical protein
MSEHDAEVAWDHAWKYFNVHATQRMSVFNFYLIFVGLLTAGMVKTFDQGFPFPWFGCVLGGSLILMSFIFWRFDERTRFLIQRGEDALKVLERSLQSPDETIHPLQIFLSETAMTSSNRRWFWPTTYTHCLRLTFGTFALLGLVGSLLALRVQMERAVGRPPCEPLLEVLAPEELKGNRTFIAAVLGERPVPEFGLSQGTQDRADFA